MGIETAQCKCVSGAPQRAGPFDIILCDRSRVLPSAHTEPVGVGRRWGAGVPRERATASPKHRRAPATLRDCNGEWRLQLTASVIPMLGVESQARWRARSEFSE
jgi:hypothetical protein